MVFKTTLTTLALTFMSVAAVIAHANDFQGPTQGKGLHNETVGDIDLPSEIRALAGHNLRMRLWRIAPGGIVPVHSHRGRPGIIYVEQGEIYEHRSDQAEPKLHKVGSISVESKGISHWWENKGSEVVKLVAVDVYRK